MQLPSLSAITTSLLISISASIAYADTSDSTPAFFSAIVQLPSDDIDNALATLEDQGAIILHTRSDMALAYIPTEGLNDLKRTRGVIKIDRSRKIAVPAMDKARQWHDAYKIAEGHSLPMPYDGTGVIFGLCDTGFDPSHPNFLSADGSESRVTGMFYYDEDLGTVTRHTDREEILHLGSDNADTYHATHVAGIAAGAYPNGYQGMAPGAKIVFAGMKRLTDACILVGIEDMLAYAKKAEKPLVVNLSLGNYTGPHDGSTLFNQYLDLLGQEAIICMSSGNEGTNTGTLQHDFTDTTTPLTFQNADWDGLHPYGQTDVWSADHTPFLFNLNIFHKANDNFDFPQLDFTTRHTPWRISTDPEDPDYDPLFAQFYSNGEIVVSGGISPHNGRYYVSMTYDCESITKDPASLDNPTGQWSLYWISSKILALKPDTHVDVYADATHSFLRNNPEAGPAQSVSDLACGFNTLCVGMYNNRNEVPLIDGTSFSNHTYTAGTASRFSSYGTLNDGRVMPHTVAPGYMVISSANSAFTDKYPENTNWINAEVSHNGKSYYYMTEWGTSMACPYVAGSIATWLQACPRLNINDIKEIVAATNLHDYPEPDDPRNGQGHFNPYKGMMKVMESAALEVPSIWMDALSASLVDKRIILTNSSQCDAVMQLFDMHGVEMMHHTVASESRSEIPTDYLSSGIYTARLAIPSGHFKTIKISIK